VRRCYIEKCDFVGTRVVVSTRYLHRITGVAYANKIDPFDNTSLINIEAGNYALGECH
jgi:hypothetical protein